MDGSELSVYLHLPICPTRCAYCDFYSETFPDSELGRIGEVLVDAILEETAAWLRASPIVTVYIGGGSPTAIGWRNLRRLLEGLSETLPLTSDAEWTVETHPADLTPELLGVLTDSLVTRVSLGVQSFDPSILRRVGRRDADSSDFQRLGGLLSSWSGDLAVDLIGELPTQTLVGMEEDLRGAVDLGASHISVYPLSWPSEARFGDPRERWGHPDFDCWDLAEKTLAASGFRRYEVSNFALPAKECRHSLAYWHLLPHIGIGPGAVGTLPLKAGVRREEAWTLRTTGIRPISRYIAAVQRPAVLQESQSKRESFFERLMMGLRLTEGVDVAFLIREYGSALVEEALLILEVHRKAGLLEKAGGEEHAPLKGTPTSGPAYRGPASGHPASGGRERLRCTPAGRKRLDALLRDLVALMEV